MIKQLAFCLYPVSDIPKARHFYENLLGLKLSHNFQDQWLEYDIEGFTLAVCTADTEHQPGKHGPVVALEVQDINKMASQLKSKGVTFVKEVSSTPVCHIAVISDPAGNQLILHQKMAH
jgi:predicted enzyme related to lactoylglutathione lyase